MNAPPPRRRPRATRPLGRLPRIDETIQRAHEDFRIFYALTRRQAEGNRRESMTLSTAERARTVTQALEAAIRENPAVGRAYDVIVLHPDGRQFHFSGGGQRSVVAQIVKKLTREGVPRRSALAGAMEAAGVTPRPLRTGRR